jgi:hypothetical protein
VFRFLLVLAAATPLSAADDKLPGPKIDFPEVKGFTRGKPQTFPQVELGYALAYNHDSPRIAFTVYVSNKGLKEIPAGAKSDPVRTEMKGVADTIQELARRGVYKVAREVGEEEVVPLGKAKGAPAALHRVFEITQMDGGKTLSEAYVTGYKNHFVKFRVTYPAADKDEARKKIATLLEALGEALK